MFAPSVDVINQKCGFTVIINVKIANVILVNAVKAKLLMSNIYL